MSQVKSKFATVCGHVLLLVGFLNFSMIQSRSTLLCWFKIQYKDSLDSVLGVLLVDTDPYKHTQITYTNFG